jgi:hypothetical protein
MHADDLPVMIVVDDPGPKVGGWMSCRNWSSWIGAMAVEPRSRS